MQLYSCNFTSFLLRVILIASFQRFFCSNLNWKGNIYYIYMLRIYQTYAFISIIFILNHGENFYVRKYILHMYVTCTFIVNRL